MHWVWNHSQAKGNTRIALLYIADQVRTSECEVRLGRSSLMRYMNAAKNTVKEAIEDAEKLGELIVVEPAVGRRAALYRLPMAVNHARMGSEADPQESRRGSRVDPLRAKGASRRGSESDPQESVEGQFSTARGSKVDPLPHNPKEQASSEASDRPDAFTRCQPLVKAMTEAGIVVSWSMKPSDWLEIASVVDRAGVTAMVRYAVDTKTTARQPIRYATFFLRGGWKGLPPAAANVPPPRQPGSQPPYCGDPDCDEISRTREIEDDRGIRSLQRCPDCHPASKGQAA